MHGVALLRKPSLMASVASKRTISMLTAGFQGFHHQYNLPPLSSLEQSPNGTSILLSEARSFSSNGCGLGRARSFHARSAQLDFKASMVSPAEFAAADYSDEEKVKSNCKSLEISKLDIDQDIVTALAARGITKLFPIQRGVLEPAMAGVDTIGLARTGAGKTLAFGIPIMDKIIRLRAKNGHGKNPLALVLAPKRELAKQVEKEFTLSSTKLKTLCFYGESPIGHQLSSLDHGVDVVVGTPRRLIDLLNRGALDLSEVRFLVLDEADQMPDASFQEKVGVILQKLPFWHQSFMFSATMPSWLGKIIRNYFKGPVTIDLVGDLDLKLADSISLCSVVADHRSKAAIIGPLIKEHANGGQCIVFTQTIRDADRLEYTMARITKCEAFHKDISVNRKKSTLEGFREGRLDVLVTTDYFVTRGIDVPNVDLIIHYEVPNSVERFALRSGRTGRDGKKGTVILIHSDEDERAVRTIERCVQSRFKKLPPIAVDSSQLEMYGGDMDFGGGGGDGRFGGRSSGRFGGGYSGSSEGDGYGSSRSSGFGGSGRSSGFGSFHGSEESGVLGFWRKRLQRR